MLKAIETHYKGYRFRSRLEARWAVFFDALKEEWRYEDEGYVLPSGLYLPDFYLPRMDCWIEVKGKPPIQHEIELCEEIVQGSAKCMFFARGMPGENLRVCMPKGSGIIWRACQWALDHQDLLCAFHSSDPSPYNCIKSYKQIRIYLPSRFYNKAKWARFEYGD
jgi:hypothetical protein